MSYLYDDKDYMSEFETDVTHGGIWFYWKNIEYYIDTDLGMYRIFIDELNENVRFKTLQDMIDNYNLHDGTPLKALLDGTIPRE